MRLAVLSPLPPAATGIADYTTDVVTLLAGRHEVDLYHDQLEVDDSRLPEGCHVQPADTFPEQHRRHSYDLAVYQMGNGPAHSFLYDHLSRVPGLLVLHDLVLHHSRAAHFLEAEPVRAWRSDPTSAAARTAAQPWLDAWRQELEYNYPGRGDHLFEAHLGTVGHLLPYAYPLARIPVEASRMTAVHNAFMAARVRDEVPGAEVARLPQPVEAEHPDPGTVRAIRGRLGFREDDVVVATFGLLTPEKRLETVARAVAWAAARDPRVRLLMAGPNPDEAGSRQLLERLGVASRAVMTGRVPFEELAAHIEVADIVVQLRYPTARETSAALLRVLAQGRPTVISDLAHQAEIPVDAVVRVDLTDEEDGVAHAILRLAAEPERRGQLGVRAARYVRGEHSPEATRTAWEDVLERVRGCPDPPSGDWPAHWPRAREVSGRA